MKTLGQRTMRSAFISLVLGIAVGGCELIAAVDREAMTGAGGSNQGSGGSAVVEAGSDEGAPTGSGGDMTGSGGTSGAGGDEGMDGATGGGTPAEEDAADAGAGGSDAGSPDDATNGDSETELVPDADVPDVDVTDAGAGEEEEESAD